MNGNWLAINRPFNVFLKFQAEKIFMFERNKSKNILPKHEWQILARIAEEINKHLGD